MASDLKNMIVTGSKDEWKDAFPLPIFLLLPPETFTKRLFTNLEGKKFLQGILP